MYTYKANRLQRKHMKLFDIINSTTPIDVRNILTRGGVGERVNNQQLYLNCDYTKFVYHTMIHYHG